MHITGAFCLLKIADKSLIYVLEQKMIAFAYV